MRPNPCYWSGCAAIPHRGPYWRTSTPPPASESCWASASPSTGRPTCGSSRMGPIPARWPARCWRGCRPSSSNRLPRPRPRSACATPMATAPPHSTEPGGSIRTANHWIARPGASSSSQAVASSRSARALEVARTARSAGMGSSCSSFPSSHARVSAAVRICSAPAGSSTT